MGEEKRKGRFIYVTVDEPDQPQHKFSFFTDVPSGSIVEGSTGMSGVYLLPEQYEERRYPRASPWHFKISQASLDLHPGVLAIGRI
jgi:hypothetical protein